MGRYFNYQKSFFTEAITPPQKIHRSDVDTPSFVYHVSRDFNKHLNSCEGITN